MTHAIQLRRRRALNASASVSADFLVPDTETPPEEVSREAVQTWHAVYACIKAWHSHFASSGSFDLDVVPSAPETRSWQSPASDLLDWYTIRARLVGMRVVLPKPGEVRSYLEQYPELVGVLESVCRDAAAEFGGQAELSLELYRDPEIEDRHLSLYVRLPAYDNTLMRRIDAFCARHEDRLCDQAGTILVTTDYRPPRF